MTKNVLHFNILYESVTFKTTIAKAQEGMQSQLLTDGEPRLPRVDGSRKVLHEQIRTKSEHDRQQTQVTSSQFLLKITPKKRNLPETKMLSSYPQIFA